MRLRNKKTGEIVDDGYVRETHDFQFDGQKHVLAVFKGNGHRPPERVSRAYSTLAELNEEWEDYKPIEPLIKDEKIRKAVRAWAEATRTTSISYWGGELESEQNDSKIEFDNIAVVEFGDNYTIAELCGSEEIEILEPTYTTIEEKEKLKEKE